VIGDYELDLTKPSKELFGVSEFIQRELQLMKRPEKEEVPFEVILHQLSN